MKLSLYRVAKQETGMSVSWKATARGLNSDNIETGDLLEICKRRQCYSDKLTIVWRCDVDSNTVATRKNGWRLEMQYGFQAII
jgi:hypothetical protein